MDRMELEAMNFINAHKELSLFKYKQMTKSEKVKWFSRFLKDAKQPEFFQIVIDLVNRSE